MKDFTEVEKIIFEAINKLEALDLTHQENISAVANIAAMLSVVAQGRTREPGNNLLELLTRYLRFSRESYE